MVSTDAAEGVLLGLACGDALGRPLEFTPCDEIARQHGTVTEMLADGTHGKPAGTVTDDTELALRIARSLVENERFDGQDIADRFLEWFEDDPFDIGLMTADALREYSHGTDWRSAGQEVWQHRAEGSNAGNGSVMRCAPHAIAFADDPDTLARVSKQSSAITHHDPRCQYGCAILNETIAGYLRGEDDPFGDALARVDGEAPDELVETLRLVPDLIDDTDLETSGYVVHTLQTALYDALTADSAEAAIVSAVNRGGDTDTIGAVAGAVAGARFGAESLPDRWLDPLDYREDLSLLARLLATTEISASV
ncbi:ADP-ribosyl-(dinitrogen reductase) hydrolase [Halorhabdus utahensis DSM 12940]|uniref:ADP-ribosyl-(Dinitrogen reductase) hydrolase n=1 Tax=Halorhabdus utahensis (strain DSM 12940 / JCM 11049 / AX-2) TaxID=519442 RepID=C7NQZ9_HALUD|nr:ADP-ribosylglycohydrolase family protein [Halorhabdus utahensis]ACV11903.1 ADP-ribosyl-(dinitrogen reductase) hydrolase [Halorhabdus utahensis DSM 12940]